MDIIFGILIVLAIIGVSLIGSLFALCAETVMVEYLIVASIILAISGVYYSILPFFDNISSKTGAIIKCVSISSIYVTLVIFAIVAIIAEAVVLQRVVATALLVNLIVAFIFFTWDL